MTDQAIESTPHLSDLNPSGHKWWRNDSILIGATVLVLLAVTVRDYGLTTDEPLYIENNERLIDWFRGLPRDGIAASFSRERLSTGFYYSRPDNKNLPLVSYVSTIGYMTVGRFDSPLAAWRWGNLIVFAITAGLIYQWVKTDISRPAAIVAIAGLLGTPRLYAHANLLAIDTLVGCLWVLASWFLFKSERNWRRIVVFAVLCGIGAMSKPTFWFAIPGWLLWCAVFRRADLRRVCLVLITITPLVAVLLAPMWWPNPISGVLNYVEMLRHDDVGWKIGVYYFATVYQTDRLSPVPWHSVIVLPLITTPLWLILLTIAGLARGFFKRNYRGVASLWAIGVLTLPFVCALPSTPAHDGLRLYRAAFFFVPMFAAIGFELLPQNIIPYLCRLVSKTENVVVRSIHRIKSGLAVAIILFFAIWPCWNSHPSQLSHYNVMIGGLAGATELGGFEISYWGDLANPKTLADMQATLPQDATFFTFPRNPSIDLIKKWGYLREDIEHVLPEQANYVLIYGRLGWLVGPKGSRGMVDLFNHGQPLWEHRIDGVRVMALFARPSGPLKQD